MFDGKHVAEEYHHIVKQEKKSEEQFYYVSRGHFSLIL